MTSTDLLRLYHSVRVAVIGSAAVVALITGALFGWYRGLALALFVGLSLAHALIERRDTHRYSFETALFLDTAVAAAGALVIGLHVVAAVVFAFLMAVVGVLADDRRWPLLYVVGWFIPVMVGLHVIPQPPMSLALEVVLEVAAVVLFAGGIWYLVSAIVDRLRTAETSRGIMLGKVSHELRNALTGAKGMAEVLREQLGELEAAEISEMADMIASEASEADQIVEDLLVTARAERGALEMEAEVLDLRGLAEEVVQRRAPHASVIGPDHLGARGDPLRIRQILRNLLSNAERYGGDRVEIRLDRRDNRALLAVADDGPGVPEGDEEVVFGSFARSRGRRHPDSVGLGLAVSLQLARAMGGDLTYRRAEGWTIFEFSLGTARRVSEPVPV